MIRVQGTGRHFVETLTCRMRLHMITDLYLYLLFIQDTGYRI